MISKLEWVVTGLEINGRPLIPVSHSSREDARDDKKLLVLSGYVDVKITRQEWLLKSQKIVS